jgi:nucleoside phosphorylase
VAVLVAAARRVPPAKLVLPRADAPSRCKFPEQDAVMTFGRAAQLLCVGALATGDQFVEFADFAKYAAARDGAATIDMETAAVAQEATVASIPFAAVRVITDVVGRGGESTFQCSKVPATRRLSAVHAGAFRMLGTGEREQSLR